jgi:hypothetical protein
MGGFWFEPEAAIGNLSEEERSGDHRRKASDDLAHGTLVSILKQGGLIILEETSTGFFAYSPDITGCGNRKNQEGS